MSMSLSVDQEDDVRSHTSMATLNQAQPPPIHVADFSPSHLFIAPDDVRNPVTSRTWKEKNVFMICISLPAFAVTFASTIVAPSGVRLAERFDVSEEVINVNITLSVIGFGLSPFLFGPLSESVGRRPILLLGSALFTIFNVGIVFANSASSVLALRFFAFLFGGASITLSIASLPDITTYAERSYYYAIAGFFLFSGAAMGAIAGGLLEGGQVDPDWSLRLLPISSFVAILPYAFFCRESYAPILQRRHEKGAEIKRRSSATTLVSDVFDSVKSTLSARSDGLKQQQQQQRSEWSTVRKRYVNSLIMPCRLAISEPLILCVTAYVSLVYFLLYCSLEALPFAFGVLRGWSTSSVALSYFALLVGFALSTIWPLSTTTHWYVAKVARATPEQDTVGRPEARLRDMLWCGLLAPIGLFLFAWTAPFPDLHWLLPVLGLTLFGFTMNVAFTAFLPYLADVYGPNAASALAVPALVRCLFASSAPLFSKQAFKSLTLQGTMSLFAGLFAILSLIPWLFWLYGPALRSKSRFAKSN